MLWAKAVMPKVDHIIFWVVNLMSQPECLQFVKLASWAQIFQTGNEDNKKAHP